MLNLADLNLTPQTNRVFEIFEEISAIPRGSGNRAKIADYCESFAKKHSLKYIRDNEDNIIIFKEASDKNQKTEPVILQGHLDIVCQKTAEHDIDFLNDGLKIYRDGDFIKADGTTLGADNGIAVASIMAILESDQISHPPIEAVFTADEEIGLLGAAALDKSLLTAKRMINLDSEEDDTLTVSCAGGNDVILNIPLSRKNTNGQLLTLNIKGLMGGHSGMEINKARTNANVLMGNILSILNEECDFDIISINGGTKPNAIPNSCSAEICVNDKEKVLLHLQNLETLYSARIKQNEPDFYLEVENGNCKQYSCLDSGSARKLLDLLANTPNGVIKMSDEIEGLVETSLNLGIITTEADIITAHISLRSSKEAELKNLTEQILQIGKKADAESFVSGFYPPWEYNVDSPLRELYKSCYKELLGKDIKVEAIHAGLECAVFASAVKNLDCISVGPNIYDVHTTKERLSISSTVSFFELLLSVLKKCCEI